MPAGQVCPELLVLLLWVIQKLVDGLVIDVAFLRAAAFPDLLFEPACYLLGRPAKLQLLKDKASKSLAVAQQIFLVGVTLPCFSSLVGLDGAIDPINLVSFQLLSNA